MRPPNGRAASEPKVTVCGDMEVFVNVTEEFTFTVVFLRMLRMVLSCPARYTVLRGKVLAIESRLLTSLNR